MQSRATTRLPLAAPIPVYVAYFTAADGGAGEVVRYPDLYGKDEAVVAALVDRKPSGEKTAMLRR